MRKKRFHVTIEADFYMDVDDLWPDGDAPDNPTAENVCELIRDGYYDDNKGGWISDWTLDSELRVVVDGVDVWP